VIHVYWLSLSWIPKGILEKIQKLCFAFLWRGNKDYNMMARVHWERIAIPKALGGWGLKNIFMFSTTLATKVSWCLIHTHNLWTQVVTQKYIAPFSILEWVRNPDKSRNGSSRMWKAMVQAYALVGNGIIWRICNGRQVCLGMDPWVGCGRDLFLHEEVRELLADRGHIFLHQVDDLVTTNVWQQGWMLGDMLGLNV
jgi:hypothetical protein